MVSEESVTGHNLKKKEATTNKNRKQDNVNYKQSKNAIVKGEGRKEAVRIICNANMLKTVVKTFM